MDINGTGFYSTIRHRWIAHDDFLHGSNDADDISGGGGSDHIWAGAGSDSVDGGAGNDFLYAGHSDNHNVTAWGQDFVYGGSGNDTIDWSISTERVVIFGDDMNNQQTGADTIFGGYASDLIYGGLGGDTIYGGKGDDVIYGDLVNATSPQDVNKLHGGMGDDTIRGGAGTDFIWGDSGVDDLYGGQGADVFKFDKGDTGGTYTTSDVIHDFNASTNSHSVWDTLDFAVKGTSSNFGHIVGHIDTSHNSSYKQDFDQAKAFAQNAMDNDHRNLTYEFVTDGHNGWLFADTDRTHGIDTAIELKGVTDMSYLNIV